MVTHDAPFLASVLSDNDKMFLALGPPGSFFAIPPPHSGITCEYRACDVKQKRWIEFRI